MARLFKEHLSKLPIEKIARDVLPSVEFVEDTRGELWCPCPFHHDKNPSFSININPSSQHYGLYHCFACGGGNIVNYVHQLKGFDSYEEAEDWIRDNYLNEINDEWEKEDILARAMDPETPKKSFHVDEFDFYEVSHSGNRHPWMYAQGLTDEAIEHFQITYDQGKDGVIFPHIWKNKVIGWQTRDLSGENRAKYLNTPNFPKSSTLYHGDCDCHKESNYLIVVESPKTCAIMWGVGYHNTVATFGASINEDQMRLLWPYENIFLWFDNDEAGAKATRTALNLLKDQCEVYIVPPVDVPKGDPADVPYEEWEGYLNRAEYYLHWNRRKTNGFY
jgi:DNA primase